MASREYYLAHREERLAYQLERYAKKRAQLVAYQRAYRAANTDAERERAKSWKAKNRDKVNALCRAHYRKHAKASNARNKSWRDSHASQEKARSRAYWATHPEYRKKSAEKVQRRKAQKLNTSIGKVDYQQILEDSGGVCGICKKPLDLLGTHFDHIVPLSRGGAHVALNIRASHAYCNLSKGARLDGEMAWQ